MELPEIKIAMKNYRDFYGSQLLGSSNIDNCKNLFDCEEVIETHREHLESMLSDANSHLNNFRSRIGLI